MIRVLVSDFPLDRRCDTCDCILSSSLWDSRLIAIRIRKNSPKSTIKYVQPNRATKFECIQCATKEFLVGSSKRRIRKTSLEEIENFLQIKEIAN